MDVFWSFAFGAGFAAAAAHQLRLAGPSSSIYENNYFAYTMCFLSMSKIFPLYFATLLGGNIFQQVFAPSGIYLLWAFPGWESMFVLGDKNTIHAILPTIFSFTNIALGVLGYTIVARLALAVESKYFPPLPSQIHHKSQRRKLLCGSSMAVGRCLYMLRCYLGSRL